LTQHRSHFPANKKECLRDYKTLLKELKNYEADLLDKPRIICFTKVDAVDEELKKKLTKLNTEDDKILISSVSGENLKELKDLIWKKISEVKEQFEN
jgi:GTP-binding protein